MAEASPWITPRPAFARVIPETIDEYARADLTLIFSPSPEEAERRLSLIRGRALSARASVNGDASGDT